MTNANEQIKALKEALTLEKCSRVAVELTLENERYEALQKYVTLCCAVGKLIAMIEGNRCEEVPDEVLDEVDELKTTIVRLAR